MYSIISDKVGKKLMCESMKMCRVMNRFIWMWEVKWVEIYEGYKVGDEKVL